MVSPSSVSFHDFLGESDSLDHQEWYRVASLLFFEVKDMARAWRNPRLVSVFFKITDKENMYAENDQSRDHKFKRRAREDILVKHRDMEHALSYTMIITTRFNRVHDKSD